MDRRLPVSFLMSFTALAFCVFLINAPAPAAGQDSSSRSAAHTADRAKAHAAPSAGKSAAAARPTSKATPRNKKGLHGRPWAFGRSSDRDAAIWRQGVPPESLHERAVAGAVEKKSVDTARGIDNALDTAAQEKKKKSGLGISMESEVSTWREPLPSDAARPDECLPRESRHILRAFADVEAGEDLSISLGPELILKDDQGRERVSNSNQPDSALGMGMQFKLDF